MSRIPKFGSSQPSRHRRLGIRVSNFKRKALDGMVMDLLQFLDHLCLCLPTWSIVASSSKLGFLCFPPVKECR